jgi:hypothetical protein
MDITRIYLVENCFGDSNKIYIGKTKVSRKNPHKRTFGSQITYTYIDEVEGYKKEDWKPLEIFWIEQFRQWGFELMNKNEGGQGPDFWTEEQKLAVKGKLKPTSGNRGKRPGTSTKLGKPISEETKLKISKSNKGISRNKGYKYPKHIKQKMSESKFKPILQFDKQNNFIKEWKSLKNASNNIKGDIWACCKGYQKTAGGFIFKYKDNG